MAEQLFKVTAYDWKGDLKYGRGGLTNAEASDIYQHGPKSNHIKGWAGDDLVLIDEDDGEYDD